MRAGNFRLGYEFRPHRASVERMKAAAFIIEQTCIGCTLCIQACPVDAIIGSSKQMHTVVSRYCTGCELCLPPCPVDCITLVKEPHITTSTSNVEHPGNYEEWKAADQARARSEFRSLRLEREKTEKAAYLAAKAAEARATRCL